MPLNNPAGGLAYYEIVPVTVIRGGADATGWFEWDLSASIPANALYAEICGHTSNSAHHIGARVNGSALDRKIQVSTDDMTLSLTTGLDSA
ncbi:unnamed protein product, partial [marine sediment metagenome]